jgi:SNF family Na+-dependent transporter
LFDFITSNILMPLNSIIICIIFGWFVKIKKVLFFKNEHIYKVFSVLVKYIVPIVLTALMICGLVK